MAKKSLDGESLSFETFCTLLDKDKTPLLSLLHVAYEVRHTYWHNEVHIHIINNAKNGNCPEDCSYCAQAKPADTAIADYPIKTDAEIMAEAKQAYESGAHRYCMVFAGRGPSKGRIKKLSQLIQDIKTAYPIEVCVSPGLLDDDDAVQLKRAGLDRLNHNLNTSEKMYEKICSTHTFQDRLNTLNSAKKAGLDMCAGMIIGMGETPQDIYEVLTKLRDIEAKSIPINFYIPIKGTLLYDQENPLKNLSPDRCLRVLCLARLLNPKAEIRAAAGRELHLRSMQAMALYPANSLFMDGYLNTKGANTLETLEMIKDAGFTIKSDKKLDDLIALSGLLKPAAKSDSSRVVMKQLEDLKVGARY